MPKKKSARKQTVQRLQAEIKRLKSKLQKKSSKQVPIMSAKKALPILERQKQKEKLQELQKRAEEAVKKFRPKKEDRGKLIFIGTKGNRNAAQKGRKGYVVYVSKTGKKSLVPDYKQGLKSRKVSDFELPMTKKLLKARKEFFENREKLGVISQHTIVKVTGAVKPAKEDFGEYVVNKIAGSLSKVFKTQISQRRFKIEINLLVKLPDGDKRTFEIEVQINKPDHIAIEKGGLKNFIRKEVYSHLAKRLAFDGYVTGGSANHIRGLKENQGKPRSKWTKDGQLWEGHDYTTVKIETLEWRVIQLNGLRQ